MTAPITVESYEQLGRLIETALEYAGHGDTERTAQALDAISDSIASMPEHAPAEALPALRRAELMHKRLVIELERNREALGMQLGQLDRVQRAADGYMPPRDTERISTSA